MTSLLKLAFQEISKLPDEQQDVIAQSLLDELSIEKKWDALFAQSEDLLAGLANEAIGEYRAAKKL